MCHVQEWADYLFPGHKEAACPPAPVAQLDPLLSSI